MARRKVDRAQHVLREPDDVAIGLPHDRFPPQPRARRDDGQLRNRPEREAACRGREPPGTPVPHGELRDAQHRQHQQRALVHVQRETDESPRERGARGRPAVRAGGEDGEQDDVDRRPFGMVADAVRRHRRHERRREGERREEDEGPQPSRTPALERELAQTAAQQVERRQRPGADDRVRHEPQHQHVAADHRVPDRHEQRLEEGPVVVLVRRIRGEGKPDAVRENVDRDAAEVALLIHPDHEVAQHDEARDEEEREHRDVLRGHRRDPSQRGAVPFADRRFACRGGHRCDQISGRSSRGERRRTRSTSAGAGARRRGPIRGDPARRRCRAGRRDRFSLAPDRAARTRRAAAPR